MANEPTTLPYDPDDRRDEAIASFEEARDAGRNPDPRQWLDRYPEVADRLQEYFAGAGLLERVAAPLLPPPEPPAPPPDIKGYRILGLIGAGGMGMVYRAAQLVPDRLVALKVIRPDMLDGLAPEQRREAIQRFMTEARAAARLGHEGIVPVFEVGEAAGRPFYSMRYVEGASLADLIAQGPLDPRRAAAYLEQVPHAPSDRQANSRAAQRLPGHGLRPVRPQEVAARPHRRQRPRHHPHRRGRPRSLRPRGDGAAG